MIASDGFMEEATSENILVGTADGAPLDVPVRQEPAARPQRRGGHRPGQERLLRRRRRPRSPPSSSRSPRKSWCSTACAWCSTTCRRRGPAEMTFSVPDYKPTAAPRTWRRPCTTCCRCAAPRPDSCAGPPTCRRRWTSSATPRSHVASTTGRSGPGATSASSSPRRATSTNTPTTRPCAWPMPATPRGDRRPGQAAEIARELPQHAGYYGDLRHNVKAVYQFYLGAYDGNPANLNPLPPQRIRQTLPGAARRPDKAVAAGRPPSTRATSAGRPSC